MAQRVSGRSDAVKSESFVSVPAPPVGMEAIVSAADAVELRLGFEPGGVDAAREGNDLVFTFDDGGSVRILGFFVVEEMLPVLVLPDGNSVSAADYLAANHPDMDLSTAAAAQAPESGGTSYHDDAGNLLGGVERYGDQEAGAGWDNMFPLPGEMMRVERLVAADDDTGPLYTPLRGMHLHRYDPLLRDSWFQPSEPLLAAGTEYRYTARMATGAAGAGKTADGTEVPGAWRNGDFRLNILADSAAMTPDPGTEASTVAGLFAANGGKTSIQANNINIAVSGQGFEGGSGSSVVGALFAQRSVKGVEEGDQDHLYRAEVALKARGDVNLGVGIAGDAASRGHSGITYAGVSASDRGRVTVESGDDVVISISDQTTGGALDAAGVYGIYSGYGLRNGDLAKRSDFASDDTYRDYIYRLRDQYYLDSWSNNTGDGYVPGDQSLADIKAAGDVQVKMDLGSTKGPVSGIRLECGDARVTAGGDIDISTALRGAHSGGGIDKASAVSITDGGRLDMTAKGDVNLSVQGDGRNLSVMRIGDGPVTIDARGEFSMGTFRLLGTIQGRNVNITGTAGVNGAADVNEIIGFEMGGKKNKFLLSADEKISIDVSTLHRGNEGSATGVMIQRSSYPYHYSGAGLYMNAPEVEIAARINPADAASAGLAHDTTATAFRVSAFAQVGRGTLSVDGRSLWGGEALNKLNLVAEGGRRNYGLHVTPGELDPDRDHYASLQLSAEELNIRAAGGVADGRGSGSYGIAAKGDGFSNYSSASLSVGTLSVTVENPENSVGLSADGGSIDITGGSHFDPKTGQYTPLPLTIIISCTITDPSALPGGARAVAIEALNEGSVSITSYSECNDTVILKGDMLARSEDQYPARGSSIHIGLGNGSDRVEINGDIRTEGTLSTISIDAGKGNDVLIFSGKIHASAGIDITAGAGNDLLVLKAESAEAFAARFKDWLETPGVLDGLSCESIIIQGLDPAHGQTWLSNLLAANPAIDVQYFGTDTNVTVVNSAEQLGKTFHLAGTGNDDLLYLRFDDAENGLKSMNKAVSEGRVSGLEKLVLDIANGHDDGGLNTDLLNNLIGGAKGNGSEVRLRADNTDAGLLQNAGWTAGNSRTTIDGTEYTVYNHPDLGEMYVKLITG